MKAAKNPKRHIQSIGILAFISAILVLVIVNDNDTEPEWLSSHNSRRQLSTASPPSQSHEKTHNEDKFCTVQVHDGTITSASVINEAGSYHLSLPRGYDSTASIECTHYTRKSSLGEPYTSEEQSYTNETTIEHGVKVSSAHLRGIISHEDGSDCEQKSFQPGYYNSKTRTWYDHCMGRHISTRNSNMPEQLAHDTCPYVANKQKKNENEPIWVLFVGDSVGRKMWFEGLSLNGISMPHGSSPWYKYYLTSHDQISFSFMFNYIKKGQLFPDIPYTWGDFVKAINGGSREDHPDFPMDKIPDIVFFGPGYHASNLASTAYGTATEEIITKWHLKWSQIAGTSNHEQALPQIHLILNVMPAPWMIPNKYAGDVHQRTLLNEYRKNLALIAVAKKFADSHVKSVVDVFSIELPLNGKVEAEEESRRKTAHRDAVHIRQDVRFWKLAGQRILHALCHSDY